MFNLRKEDYRTQDAMMSHDKIWEFLSYVPQYPNMVPVDSILDDLGWKKPYTRPSVDGFEHALEFEYVDGVRMVGIRPACWKSIQRRLERWHRRTQHY